RKDPAAAGGGGPPAAPPRAGGAPRPPYSERRLELGGVEIALYEAGRGEPLLFLHGAGTATGFDSLLPLAEHFRLIVPHHPGYGNSADDVAINSVHDYERHYLDLLD